MEIKKKADPPVDGADRLTMKFGLVNRTPGREAKIVIEVTGLEAIKHLNDRDELLRNFAQCSHKAYMELAGRLNQQTTEYKAILAQQLKRDGR